MSWIEPTLKNEVERTEQALVIADSAEPKSIEEIKGYGVSIIGSEKGKDSVAQGIQLVQDQKISVIKRSINIIKEYRTYLWTTDKDGKILNEPEHTFSHSMDGIRYGIVSLVKAPANPVSVHRPSSTGYNRR